MQHRSGGLTSDLPAQQAFQLDGFEGVQRPASQRQLDLMGRQGAHPNRLGGPTVDDRAVAQKVQIALTVRLHTAQRAVHVDARAFDHLHQPSGVDEHHAADLIASIVHHGFAETFSRSTTVRRDPADQFSRDDEAIKQEAFRLMQGLGKNVALISTTSVEI